MKRYFALLIGIVALIFSILSGCGKQSVQDTSDPDDGNTLSVYVVDTDALYVDAMNSFKEETQDITLNITTFSSYDTMFDVLNEALKSKGGPDVVLYNSRQSQVDGQTLAQSGHFLPLDDFVAQLDPGVYPTALMEAGKIAGKQYFIPFSYSLIYAYTSEQLMADAEYSPVDSVYEMILAESEALMGVLDRSPTAMNILRPDPVNGFFEAAGIQFFDKHTGVVTVDKAALAEICRFVKSHYENMEKRAVLYQQFAGDFAGAPAVFSFITENYAFMNNLRFFQSMIPAATDSSMIARPYHKLNDPQVLCPSIVCFGGINVNTKVPEQAYRLLKYILDYPVSNDWPKHEEAAVYDAPVSLAVFEGAVSELASNKGYGPETITALTLEHANLLMETRKNITDAIIPNATLGIKLQAVLEPYFMGKDSFDSCYNVLLSELQLYLGENAAKDYDPARAEDCLRKAGFGDRLDRLPDGLNTYLYREFSKQGVEISGGEAQKIAIARALYADAPFIILDEPTAALDPIAEAEIYSKFDEIAGDKTAIYISHRLSSCRFCDDILVFDQGQVIQQGSHEELVADESGKYYALWHAQAQYYTKI